MSNEPDIFDLIAKGAMGDDGAVKPSARSKDDILVARILSGSNLEYAALHMKSALAFFSFLVKEKNVLLSVPSSSGERKPLTQKDYAKLVLHHYIEVAHLHSFHVAYYDSPLPPANVENVVNRLLLNPRFVDIIKEAY